MYGHAHPEALVATAGLAKHPSDPNVRAFGADRDTAAGSGQ